MTSLRALLAVVLFVTVAPAQHDLGLGRMGTFENPPLDFLKATYGFSPSQPWLDQTRLASLRFGGGCSASFVSANGLVMTNHHCVRDFVAKVSPADQDWMKNGFVASAMGAEVKLPDCKVEQLVSMRDVTSRIRAGILGSDDVAAIDEKQKANEKALLAEAKEQHPGLQAQVVRLYQGGMFQLYMHKVWTDVRIVVSPHLQTSHFGGDPDNFTYPRFGIDFAFCRVYENGKPLDTSKHFFKWSEGGAEPDELVFVTGNPGSTGRLKTHAELEFLRDVQYPNNLAFADREVSRLKTLSKVSEEAAKRHRPRLLGLQNAQKNWRWTHAGLMQPEYMEAKRKSEAAFRAMVAAKPELQKKYGSAWTELAGISLKQRRGMHYQPPGVDVVMAGVYIARITDPTAPQTTVARLSKALQNLTYDDNAESLKGAIAQLEGAAKDLGGSDPFVAAFGSGAPGTSIKSLVEKSRLGDAAVRKQLLDGGHDAVMKSKDPAIVVGRTILPLILESQTTRDGLTAAQGVHAARIGRALFAVYGTKAPPDATFTLRLADGVVKGYEYNGTIAPPRTSFFGLYARCHEFGNRHPFDLPNVWLERRNRVDMNKWVNFVSTNDIIGGNSGSPMINKDREIVGLIFDGNVEMLPNNYFYTETHARTVSVHVDAIMEALLKIYDAGWVAAELRGN